LGRAGKPAEALVIIDEVLARCERNEERWYMPELLRIKGELVLAQGGPASQLDAEVYLIESLACSRRLQTIAWNLRSAISLAKLRRDERRNAEAQEILAPVYARFTEGFDTADVKQGKALLDTLLVS